MEAVLTNHRPRRAERRQGRNVTNCRLPTGCWACWGGGDREEKMEAVLTNHRPRRAERRQGRNVTNCRLPTGCWACWGGGDGYWADGGVSRCPPYGAFPVSQAVLPGAWGPPVCGGGSGGSQPGQAWPFPPALWAGLAFSSGSSTTDSVLYRKRIGSSTGCCS